MIIIGWKHPEKHLCAVMNISGSQKQRAASFSIFFLVFPRASYKRRLFKGKHRSYLYFGLFHRLNHIPIVICEVKEASALPRRGEFP